MPPGGMRLGVLVVDDDPDILLAAQGWLAQKLANDLVPVDVLTAPEGATALAMMERRPFEVVICDYQMPGLDGLQVLSEMRRRWPQTRCVLLTANRDVRVASDAVNAHLLDAYLLKPVAPEVLLSTAARNLREALQARVEKAASEAERAALAEAQALVRELRRDHP